MGGDSDLESGATWAHSSLGGVGPASLLAFPGTPRAATHQDWGRDCAGREEES